MKKPHSKRGSRNKLLRSAKNLFYKKGYRGSSIREIGAKAGISSSIIYHYFKNKEEILFDIIFKSTEELIESLQKLSNNVTDPLECLRDMLLEHSVTFGHKKESKIILFEYYALKKKHLDVIIRQQRKIFDIYMEKLKELQQKGVITDIDLTVLTFSLLGIINSFFRWHREGGRLSKNEVAEHFIRLVFRGMLR
jgi:AcrR family transcriptional regulator